MGQESRVGRSKVWIAVVLLLMSAVAVVFLLVRTRVLQERVARLRSELTSARSEVERLRGLSEQTRVMPIGQVLQSFDLKGFTADASGESLVGSMGALKNKGDERLVKEPFKASQFEFGFSVKAKWYQGVVVRFGKYFVYYSRGHWLNSATMVATPGGERRFPEKKVEKPDEFSRVEARYDNGPLTFYYNGQVEDVVDIPAEYRSEQIVLGFCGYNSGYVIRDVVLTKR